MNYYEYTADRGNVYSILVGDNIATFMSMSVAVTEHPIIDGRLVPRKLRLSETSTGKERIVTDPQPTWTYPLGSVVLFEGDVYFVTMQLDQEGRDTNH